MQEFNQYYIFILLHTLISILIALLALFKLKDSYKDRVLNHFILIFSISFSLLFFGYFVSLWLIYYLKKIHKFNQQTNIKAIDLEQLYEYYPPIQRTFGESFLKKITQKNLPNRMKALTFISEDITKEHIKIFKKLLHDTSDEIRLYSFYILNSFEKSINQKIEKITLEYEKAKEYQKAQLAIKLGYLYWDLIYYDLIDKEFQTATFEKIKKYIAFAYMKDYIHKDLFLLAAKIYFHKKNYKKAKEMFLEAIKLNADKNNILAYLAEIEYELKNYTNVKNILLNLNNHPTSLQILNIKKEWLYNG